MGYKIVTFEEAETLDFSTLDQTSLEVARKNIDKTKVLISSDDLEGMTEEQIKVELSTSEWTYNEE